MKKEIALVLGAGPAGLAFAYRFGKGATVLEKSQNVGGLSRSVTIQDGVFDVGGHSFHTPHPEVLEFVHALMEGNWFEQTRDARVWVSGKMIPYPFQRNFEKLDDAKLAEDCRGFQPDLERIAQSQNFEDWLRRRFGEGVAQHFMLPYNRKLWAHDLKEMSCEWVGERVATDTNTSSSDKRGTSTRHPLQSDSRVGYPAQGGFGEIFKVLAARCARVEHCEDVISIDLAECYARTKSGKNWPWQKIVSTIPLPELLACLSECPSPLLKAASRLQYVSLKILLLLVNLKNHDVPQRVYIAHPGIAPHKIAFNHTSSPNLRERKYHAIMCEVSYSKSKPAPPDEELLSGAIDWLLHEGFIGSISDVHVKEVLDVPYGYPIYNHERSEILSTIKPYLEGLNIHSIGRFGSWHYANSDECIRQGLALAKRLLGS